MRATFQGTLVRIFQKEQTRDGVKSVTPTAELLVVGTGNASGSELVQAAIDPSADIGKLKTNLAYQVTAEIKAWGMNGRSGLSVKNATFAGL